MAPAFSGPAEMSLEKTSLERSIQEINTEIELLKKEAVELQTGIDGFIRRQFGVLGLLNLERAKHKNFITSRSNVAENSGNTAVFCNDDAVSHEDETSFTMSFTNTTDLTTYAQQDRDNVTELQRAMLNNDDFRRKFLAETADFETEWQHADSERRSAGGAGSYNAAAAVTVRKPFQWSP